MYASFFGLRELPFNNTPDPRFFFSTPDHEEALASLIYAIGEGKGFVLLTGEVGAGKTLVTRLMLRHFGESIEFASINNTQVTANELLQCVCSEFGIDFDNGSSNADLIHALQDFLLTSFASNKPVVLMLDEAQALSQQAFEQIRMIGNLEADDAKLLQIVIVGQPELQQRFEANDMRQLRQRIFRSFHLSALTREQTEGYIRHRLSVAGASYPTRILNSDAIDVIFEYSQGIPRLVNTVCDNALLSAYAADQKSIDAAFVRHVIRQMMTVQQGGPEFASPKVAACGGVQLPLNAQDPGLYSPYGRRQSDGPAHLTSANEVRSQFSEFNPAFHGNSYQSSFAATTQQDLNSTICQAKQLDTQLRSLIEQLRIKESHISPQMEQLQRLAVLVRRLLGETKATRDEVREVVDMAETSKSSTKEAIVKLAEQSARTGRLSVALREVFDKLERRAECLVGRAERAGSKDGGSDHNAGKGNHSVLQKVHDLERTLSTNRSAVDEVKSLINATRSSQPRTSAAGQKTETEKEPASQLASQVRVLAAMVEQSNSGQKKAAKAGTAD